MSNNVCVYIYRLHASKASTNNAQVHQWGSQDNCRLMCKGDDGDPVSCHMSGGSLRSSGDDSALVMIVKVLLVVLKK